MKFLGISDKKIISILAVLFAGLILTMVTGLLPSDSLDNFENEVKDFFNVGLDASEQKIIFTPDPASFTSPAVPSYTPKKKELIPILRTPLQPGFSVRSNYQTSDFFQGGVSYVRINIRNEGRNPIFINRYGVSVKASENKLFSEDCGVLLPPGEAKNLGVIAVQIPDEKKASFNLVLWLLASTSEGKWHVYDPYFLNGFTADLKPMQEKLNPEYRHNPARYFKIINKLVEPAEPSVRNRAAEVARAYPGAYNIYQVCALFDTVKENVQYVSDPRGNDVWEPANVTLKIGAGDCEDQAILLSSMLEAVGGTTRVYLTDTHAFAAVYIGNGTAATDSAVKGIRAYYGNVDVNYLTDRYGSWLMLDPTTSLYAGGLPGKTAQTRVQESYKNKVQRSWAFIDTTEVKAIDINPGEKL
jgi:transglutaminase-like putative cysteine protease